MTSNPPAGFALNEQVWVKQHVWNGSGWLPSRDTGRITGISWPCQSGDSAPIGRPRYTLQILNDDGLLHTLHDVPEDDLIHVSIPGIPYPTKPAEQTVKDVRSAKADLECEIAAAVVRFKDRTGCEVAGIEVSYIHPDYYPKSRLVHIDVEVKL